MTGINPDILAGCKARNRAHEDRLRQEGMKPPEPKPPRPGVVVILRCACGHQEGFRVLPPFEGVKAAVAARKVGWFTRPGAHDICPSCQEEVP